MKPYFWFKGASVAELIARLLAVGADVARLEVRTEGDKMYLRVVGPNAPESADLDKPDINDSHVCPPFCG